MPTTSQKRPRSSSDNESVIKSESDDNEEVDDVDQENEDVNDAASEETEEQCDEDDSEDEEAGEPSEEDEDIDEEDEHVHDDGRRVSSRRGSTKAPPAKRARTSESSKPIFTCADLVTAIRRHKNSWPFQHPVNRNEVVNPFKSLIALYISVKSSGLMSPGDSSITD